MPPERFVLQPGQVPLCCRAGRASLVLTPKLLRLEWSADSSFEDRASPVMLNRTLPAPKFSSDRKGSGWLEVTTEALRLPPSAVVNEEVRLRAGLHAESVLGLLKE